MFQNIKVDIIYYKTNTDFEMEFNLCGCCRMRLLTDKASDRKALIGDLSRAVSRSRVIMVVGSLFGEDNIISMVAGAIGKELSPADNKTYGINSSEEINIISGSTPLVSEDGFFGGCIIESGPQTMILLSDSKNIRKSIMNNLIHPYIEEFYAAELTGNVTATASQADEETDKEEQEVEEISEDASEVQDIDTEEIPEDIPNEALEEATEKAESEEKPEETTELNTDNKTVQTAKGEDIVLEGGMVFETDEERFAAPDSGKEETVDLFAEAKKIRRSEAKYYNEAYGDFELNDAGLIGEDGFGEPYYGRPSGTRIAVLVISILILIALAVLCYCIFYVPSKEGVSAAAYIKDIYNTLFG